MCSTMRSRRTPDCTEAREQGRIREDMKMRGDVGHGWKAKQRISFRSTPACKHYPQWTAARERVRPRTDRVCSDKSAVSLLSTQRTVAKDRTWSSSSCLGATGRMRATPYHPCVTSQSPPLKPTSLFDNRGRSGGVVASCSTAFTVDLRLVRGDC